MGKLEITKKFKGDFGQVVFENFCQQKDYAHISLEEIYKTFTPKNGLVFNHGFYRIPVIVPAEITPEIREFCKPSNNEEFEPSFVFDYLTVSLHCSFKLNEEKKKYEQMPYLTQKAFSWVEIKTGKSELTPNQQRKSLETTIGLKVFRIPTAVPEDIEVNFEKYLFKGKKEQ